MKNPPGDESDGATAGINANVRKQSRPAGHETLMIFIGGGIQKNDEQRATHPGP
jgi:hypothetical protein